MAKHRDSLQFAALPWRLDDRGMRQIMLLASRETRRWVIPKGWPMKGKKPAEVAAQEALEEAGLIGKIVGKKPLGNFHYPKRLKHRTILCEVRVYLFRVEQQLDEWPEKSQRETKWLDANEAAELVDESGLAAIIERFTGSQVRFFAFRREKRTRKTAQGVSKDYGKSPGVSEFLNTVEKLALPANSATSESAFGSL